MNEVAMGHVSDNLIDVCVFNKEGDELTIPKNDLNLEWRKTLFHKRPDLFIYSLALELISVLLKDREATAG